MHEDPYHARDIMKNPILLSSQNWTTSQTSGTVLSSFSIPNIFTAYASMQMYILSIFTFLKPTIRLTFKLNSNRFQQGALIISYDPFQQHRTDTNPANDNIATKFHGFTAATCLPHIILDASKSNEGYLDIPFDHVQSYITTNSAEVVGLMGLVRVMVLNQLQIGTGASANAGLQVYMSCVDIDLHVPIFPHTPTIPTRLVQAQMFDEIISGLKSGGSSIWNAMSGNFSTASEQASKFFGSAGKVLKNFNLDKPSKLDTASQSVIYPVEPYAHMDGLSGSVTLGVNPTHGYLHHDEFSPSTVDELNILSIAQRYSGISFQNTWSATHVSGVVLQKFPVMPRFTPKTLVPFPGSSAATSIWRYEHSWLSYITSLFGYWYGNIKYKVQFISTDFQTGRVAAVFVPNTQFPETQPTLQEMLQCPLMIMDLKEKKEFEFEVPYQASTARKVSMQFSGDISNVLDFAYDDRFSLGTLYLVVLNQLVSPSNVAQQIDYNVYIAAGDNFEWEFPTLQKRMYSIPTMAGTRSVEAQLEEERTASGEVTMLTKGDVRGKTTTGLNQRITDVRALAKRMSMVSTNIVTMRAIPGISTIAQAYGASYPYLVSPSAAMERISLTGPARQGPGFMPDRMDTSNVTDPSIGQIWMLAVARMYALWHGGLRWSMVPDDRITSGATYVSNFPMRFSASYDPKFFSEKTGYLTSDLEYWIGDDLVDVTEDSGNPIMLTHTGQQKALTVSTPYVSAYNQLIVETDSDVTSYKQDAFYAGALKFRFAGREDSNAANLSYELYAGGADDIHFSYLTAPPHTYEYTVPENAF